MRHSLSLKTLIRTPFKTAMTFLLITAASFAMFSRVADYAVTAREMSKIKNAYNGVAALDNGVPPSGYFMYSDITATLGKKSFGVTFGAYFSTPNALTSEQINAFSSLPGVTTDIRYMSGGIMWDYKRLHSYYSTEYDWGFDYNSRFIFEGTFDGYTPSEIARTGYGSRSLKFTDVKNIAGDAFVSDGGTVTVLAGLDYSGAAFESRYSFPIILVNGDDKFFTVAETDRLNNEYAHFDDPYGKEFADSLQKGDRYLFIGRYIPNTFKADSYDSLVNFSRKYWANDRYATKTDKDVYMSDEYTAMPLEEVIEWYKQQYGEDYVRELKSYAAGEPVMRLGDQDTMDYVPSFLELTDAENIAKAMELANLTNQDAHTFDIVYTANMSAIPRFNEKKMTITEGRAITAKDTDSCVVSQYFFDTYNLKIGDTLTIDLGNKLFEQNAGIGANAYIPARSWSPVKTAELKIAGVYLDIDPQYERVLSQFWGYSPNTIFVSSELLPITPPSDHKIKPGEASMLINDVNDIEAFLEKAEPLASELGLKLSFSDGGWAKIKDGVNASLRTSFINALLFIFAAGLALMLSTYLYIGRKSKDYAIMRALGTPVNKARNALALPLVALCVLAVPVGGIAGLIYTSESIKSTLGNFGIANVSLPIGVIALCFIGELAFIALLATIFLYKLGRTSPLSLLQGNVIKAADIAEIKAIDASMPATPAFVPTMVKREMPKRNQYSAFKHVMSYIFKHMRRVGLKTAISITLAAVLTGAVGLLAVTRLSYDKLYKNVEVKSTAAGLSSAALNELSKSELIKEIYFYSNYTSAINSYNAEIPLTVTNNLERFLQDDFSVEYSDGFSDNVFGGEGAFCVIGSAAAETLGVKAGDEITMVNWNVYNGIRYLYFRDETFRDSKKITWEKEGKKFETDEEFQAEIEKAFADEMATFGVPYTISGILNSHDSTANFSVFTPPSEAVKDVISRYKTDGEVNPYKTDFCEAVIADNDKVGELNDLLVRLKSESIPFTYDASHYTDTTELDNIRRVRDLLVTLFPIAVTAAILIGATAPLLIIIQSAKEAAIMRILGTTKKRTRCILAFEQILLCAVGLICAAGGLAVYNAGLFAESTPLLAVCGVLYLLGGAAAALGAAVSVTSRKVLELLQVRE